VRNFFLSSSKIERMGENDLILCDCPWHTGRRNVMDLITLVIFCNCTISIGCFILTLWTIRLRQQLATIARYCDRWANDCVYLSTITPVAIKGSREQLRHLRQIYQQQVVRFDRIQSIGLFIQITRSLLLQRRG
jgi:hypothetical protein